MRVRRFLSAILSLSACLATALGIGDCQAHVVGTVKDISSKPIAAADGRLCCVSPGTDCHEARSTVAGKFDFNIEFNVEPGNTLCPLEFRTAKSSAPVPCSLTYSGPDEHHIEALAVCDAGLPRAEIRSTLLDLKPNQEVQESYPVMQASGGRALSH